PLPRNAHIGDRRRTARRERWQGRHGGASPNNADLDETPLLVVNVATARKFSGPAALLRSLDGAAPFGQSPWGGVTWGSAPAPAFGSAGTAWGCRAASS